MPRAAKSKVSSTRKRSVPRRSRVTRAGRTGWRQKLLAIATPLRRKAPTIFQAVVLVALAGALAYEVDLYLRSPKPHTRVYRLAAAPAIQEYEGRDRGRTIAFIDEAHRLLSLPLPGGQSWVLYHRQDWGGIQIGRNVEGTPLRIAQRKYSSGIGTHANSEIRLRLSDSNRKLAGSCGVDQAAAADSEMQFRILSGSKVLFDSGLMRRSDSARDFEVQVPSRDISLFVSTTGAIGGRYADWTDLRIIR